MKKNLTTILFSIVFLAGLSLLLYPLVANEWNTYRQSKLLSSYSDAIAGAADGDTIDFEQELQTAYAYNDALLPSILPDSFAVADVRGEESEAFKEYMACLNPLGDGMMGSVEIPKINVSLPIYHTTSDDVLQHSAGHLEGSSLPVGGESTHSVISAHRGLPSASLFTDLDKLEVGDHFLFHILDETLSYEVDQILVVEPNEVDSLGVVDGEDLATLFTCTPYGVNSQRLMVRGHRVPYVEAELSDEKLPLSNMSLHTNYLLWVVVGLSVTGVFILLLVYRDRKLQKAAAAQKAAVAQEADADGGETEMPEQAKESEATEEAEAVERLDAVGEPEIADEPGTGQEDEV
ncbi:MAG: class C sortase [Lachnospiraceae bacterium]|nr:class C sortase [Lachnospiraceae bacterium]